MNTDERIKYIGACALLGRVASTVKDPELLECIEQAMQDCAEICEHRLLVVPVGRGFAFDIVPTQTN